MDELLRNLENNSQFKITVQASYMGCWRVQVYNTTLDVTDPIGAYGVSKDLVQESGYKALFDPFLCWLRLNDLYV